MRIKKKVTRYGYDLLINDVLHKRCMMCNVWFKFDGEMGCCAHCIKNFRKLEQQKNSHTKKLV